MVLTVSFVLSPVTGLFCHRRLRIWFCLSPVGPTQLRELDASVGASGPHDFAVRWQHLSSACCRSLTGSSPALQSRCAQNTAASTASAPRVRDDRDTPLWWGGMRKVLEVIWGAWEWKYFCEGDSTQNCPTGKSPRREPIPLVSRTRCSASTRRGHSSAASKLSGPDVQISRRQRYETNA